MDSFELKLETLLNLHKSCLDAQTFFNYKSLWINQFQYNLEWELRQLYKLDCVNGQGIRHIKLVLTNE